MISGDVGRHGMAVMAVREGLSFESAIESDSAPVAELVLNLLRAGIDVHCLRDLTRGGLTSALNEIARSATASVLVEEALIPIRDDVRAACEILGLDPLQVACEGRFVVFLPESVAERALEILRADPLGAGACRIGQVNALGQGPPKVVLRNTIGVHRLLEMGSGEQLPRIC